ncbi:hypothetical protein [Hydrogenophaga sp. RWCD_12]|uniref:hypothetical protein n=1 Tax=Hydrogenophaga sp. RWCD_12 TaxID=3391190 RepID=UPI0039846903
MMQLDNVRQLLGFQVHGDHQNDHTFYVYPNRPTFARMDSGGLALRFVEYGQLREDGGKKFGGFVAFDAELTVPDDALAKITAELQKEVDAKYKNRGVPPPKVQIAPILWTGGTVELLLSEGGALVEKVRGAGKPSLYGRNVASFMMELSELGTAIFKETLSTGSASAVTVVYKLDHYIRLPEMSAWGTWNASEFYSFFQDINTEDNFWSEDSYTEVVSSSRYKNDVTKTHFEFTQAPNLSPEENAKLESDVRALINKQLEAAVQRNLLKEIAEVDPNVKALQEGQDIEDIRRTINKSQIANVRVEWSEAKTIITSKAPQGQLPTVTSLKGADGKPVKWEDYYSKLSVDEFLKTVQVNMRVNASFADLPIHSVEVKISYPHGPNAKTQEFTFTSPDAVAKFECFVHQGIRKFKYAYTVNYKGSAFVFKSPEIETDDTNLTINVDDLGILALDIAPGDINFGQVDRALITVSYAGGARPFEAKFNMTKTSNTFSVRQVIEQRRTGPVQVQVVYQMTDGREIKGPVREQTANQLYIDDPFSAMKTISFRAVGDLVNEVAGITVDAVYEDAGNNYRQRVNRNLNKDNPADDWTFPVIDDALGEVRYTATVLFKDGKMKELPETVAKRSTITLGSGTVEFLQISVVPDLMDWDKAKLVNVALSYEDTANGVTSRTELRFKAGDTEKAWKVALKDAAKTEYEATTTYFLKDGSKKVVGPTRQSDLSLFLEVPA